MTPSSGVEKEAALQSAVERLRAAGHDVVPADNVPGLFFVNGRELTINQVLSVAWDVEVK
jgi:hypothetical protein